MPKKIDQTSPTEGDQTDATRDTLLEEVVQLDRKVDAALKELVRQMNAANELVGRLKDRIDALHERHNKTQEAWEVMRNTMTKHHLEQSSGAEVVGAAVRKVTARLDVIEKDLAHMTDPHKIVNPLRVEVAKAMDEMTKLRSYIDRTLETFKTDIEGRSPELKRAGKPRLS